MQEDADEPSSAINIRGLQDFGRVNVMIEGARQNFQRSGHGANGIFYIEPELIKAVDIVRGPVATIYGSGAVGGVVNFELKDAADLIYPGETWHLGVKGQYNTNDDGTLVSVTGAAQPVAWFDVVGNVVWQRDDDFFDGNGDRVVNTDEDVLSALVKGTLRFDGGHILKVTYLRQDDTYTTGDPGFQRETDTLDNTASAKWQYNPSDNPWIDFTASGYYTDTETDQTRIDLPFPCVPPFCDPTLLGNSRNFRIRDDRHRRLQHIQIFDRPVRTRPDLWRRCLPGPGPDRRPARQRQRVHAERPTSGLWRVRSGPDRLSGLAAGDRRPALRQLRTERRP